MGVVATLSATALSIIGAIGRYHSLILTTWLRCCACRISLGKAIKLRLPRARGPASAVPLQTPRIFPCKSNSAVVSIRASLIPSLFVPKPILLRYGACRLMACPFCLSKRQAAPRLRPLSLQQGGMKTSSKSPLCTICVLATILRAQPPA